jgi:AraC-like DNA-binding protein
LPLEYLELAAPPPLDALVHCFWFLRGDSGGADPHPIVSDGRVDIVLHLADPFVRVEPNGDRHRQSHALLAGQLTSPVRVAPTGSADVVGIRFRTAAAGAVLRAPLGEFTNRVESLSDTAPALSRALYDAAARHAGPRERACALACVLTRFVRAAPDPLTSHVVRALDSVHPSGVREMARQLGFSARTIERRVLDGTGLAPATLRKALRFRRVFRLLDEAPAGTWAQVAATAGYFDQAHLIRDFRQFAGATPTEFFGLDPELARAFLGPAA